MSTYREKEVELKYLSRPTLQQLAKQHNIRANLKVRQSTELVFELMQCWPCTQHSPECMLVQSADDDEFNTSMSSGPSSSHSSPTLATSSMLSSLSTRMPPAPPSPPSRVSFQPLNTEQHAAFTSTSSHSPTSDFLAPLPLKAHPSSDVKARRRTWHMADVQIGDRLLSPFRQSVGLAMMEEEEEEQADTSGVDRGTGAEKSAFEAANVRQTLRFSTLTEEELNDTPTTATPNNSTASIAAVSRPSTASAASAASSACPAWTTGVTASDKSPPFVGFITNRRGGARAPPAVRQSVRLSSRRQTIAPSSSAANPSATRRQTIAPSSKPAPTAAGAAPGATGWPATTGARPLRPASTITPAGAARPPKQRFDVAASLAKPVTWKMHKGPLAERSANKAGGGGGVKAAEGKAVAAARDKGEKEEVRVRQRREMRQKSIDYARNVQVVRRAGQENRAAAVHKTSTAVQ